MESKELKRIGLIKKAAANGTSGSSQEAVAAHGWRVSVPMAMNVAVAVLFACSPQAARSVQYIISSFFLRFGRNNEREDDE